MGTTPAPLPNEPLEAAKMLFDATKTMIPVVTGFIVFVVGTLPKLWKSSRALLQSDRRALLATVVLGVGSLVAWAFAMPCCIISTFPDGERKFLCISSQTSLWWVQKGQGCARVAHMLFLCSVCSALYLYYQNFVKGFAKPGDTA